MCRCKSLLPCVNNIVHDHILQWHSVLTAVTLSAHCSHIQWSLQTAPMVTTELPDCDCHDECNQALHWGFLCCWKSNRYSLRTQVQESWHEHMLYALDGACSACMASLAGFITSSPPQGQQTPCKVCGRRQSHTSCLPLQQSELLESGNLWA